jgi:hypothetical protein
MELPNVVEEELCYVACRHGFSAGQEVGHLSERVDDYKDAVMPLGNWEFDNHVVGDELEGPDRNRQQLNW